MRTGILTVLNIIFFHNFSFLGEALQQEITHPLLFSSCLKTEPEIKSLKMTQMHSIVSHFSIKDKGRKKEYSDAIIAFLDRCSCKQYF